MVVKFNVVLIIFVCILISIEGRSVKEVSDSCKKIRNRSLTLDSLAWAVYIDNIIVSWGGTFPAE